MGDAMIDVIETSEGKVRIVEIDSWQIIPPPEPVWKTEIWGPVDSKGVRIASRSYKMRFISNNVYTYHIRTTGKTFKHEVFFCEWVRYHAEDIRN